MTITQDYFKEGILKILQKDYDGALSDFSEAISMSPDDSNAYNNRGHVKFIQNNNAGEIADFTKALLIDPEDDIIWFNRGVANLSRYKYAEAIFDLSKSIELFEKDANAYYLRAVAKSRLHDTEGTITDILIALKIDPKLKIDATRKNPMFLEVNTYIDTITQYTRDINNNPWKKQPYYEQAKIKELAHDFNGAISDYKRIIFWDANDAKAYQKIGKNLSFSWFNYSESLYYYNMALNLAPNDTEIYFERATIRQCLGDLKGAMADLTAIIKRSNKADSRKDEDSIYIKAYYNRTLIKCQLGMFEETFTDYKRAIKLAPDSCASFIFKAEFKINQKDYSGAIEDATKALYIGHNRHEAFCARGIARMKLKNYPGAISDLNRAIKLEPKYAKSYYNRGLTKIKLKKKNGARKDLWKAYGLGLSEAYEMIEDYLL